MTIAAPIEAWFDFLAEGRFMIQRSAATGRYVFYPRMLAPGSGAVDLEWVSASGVGTVYSTTIIRQRPPVEDYNLAIVELDEGPRLMTRIEGVTPADVRIGMRVRARIVPAAEGDATLVFDAEAAA